MPFFAGILYFLVGLLESAFGVGTHDTTLNLILSLVIGSLIIAFQTVGLRYGKWITNFGAIGSWAIFFAIAGVALVFALRGASATHFASGPLIPRMNFDSAILWGTMVFAYSGIEGIAFIRNDIQGGIRTVVRIVAIVGVAMAIIYILGTAAMLVILPQSELTRLGGLADVLHTAFAHAGVPVLGSITIGLLALIQLGGLTAWFVAGAKLPMSAGVDNFLPPVFARKNEKTGVPVAASYLQGALILFMVVLSEAGASAAAAYDFLVSMSVITNSIAYVFLFAVYIRQSGKPIPEGGWRAPGGHLGRLLLGGVGLVMTVVAIVCSAIPSGDDPHPMTTLTKIVVSNVAMLVVGLVLYWLGSRRRKLALTAAGNG